MSIHEEHISKDEEVSLIRLFQSGDAEALADLLESHAGFLHQKARRAHRTLQSKFEYEDCFQTVTVGAILASKKFDCCAGYRWTTYATLWIRNALAVMRERASVIRVPKHLELKEESRMRSVCSLDVALRDSGPLWSIFTDFKQQQIDQARKAAACEVDDAIEALPDRMKAIVRKRMNGDTLESVAIDIGVTKERVRQVEEDALARMYLHIRKCSKGGVSEAIDLHNIRRTYNGAKR